MATHSYFFRGGGREGGRGGGVKGCVFVIDPTYSYLFLSLDTHRRMVISHYDL